MNLKQKIITLAILCFVSGSTHLAQGGATDPDLVNGLELIETWQSPLTGTQASACLAATNSFLQAMPACTPKGDSCEFYTGCMAQLVPCQAQSQEKPVNYAINYGYKYCQRFKNELLHPPENLQSLNLADLRTYWRSKIITDATKLWTRCTMRCLQQSIIDHYKRTDGIYKNPSESRTSRCQRYYKQAFESHPSCYTDSGLCYLMPGPIPQQHEIAGIVDPADLITEDSKEQIKQAARNCGFNYLDYASLGTLRLSGDMKRLPENTQHVLTLENLKLDQTLCWMGHKKMALYASNVSKLKKISDTLCWAIGFNDLDICHSLGNHDRNVAQELQQLEHRCLKIDKEIQSYSAICS